MVTFFLGTQEVNNDLNAISSIILQYLVIILRGISWPDVKGMKAVNHNGIDWLM